MKRKLLILSVLIVQLAAFSQTQIDSTRIIFNTHTSIDKLFGIEALTLFKPTLSEIKIADSTVMTFLSDTKKLKALYWDTIFTEWEMVPPCLDYNEYYKQYVGFLDKGSKTILINGLDQKPTYFSHRMAASAGGGCFYFRIKVTIDPPTVLSIETNAPM